MAGPIFTPDNDRKATGLNPITVQTDIAGRGFSTGEYEARLDAIQAAMAAGGVDIILLTGEHDIRYFSGFFTQFWQSPTRPWFLLVPAGGKPVAIIPQIGAECMGRTWIDDIRTWPSPHSDDDGISLLADAITELAGDTPAIGLMMGRETVLRMPLNDFERLRARLPDAAWRDVTASVQNLRAVKSEAEIAKIRRACHAASRAFAEVPGLLRPGMSTIEAFRTFKIACLDEGADDVAYLVGGAAEGGYGDIISPPTERRLGDGDILILDTGCLWDGYFCDFDRNFAVGQASDEAKAAYEIVWTATEAGLEAVRPGISCADLFHVMNRAMSRDDSAAADHGNVGRLGHGLGMQLTEFPSLTPFDQTILVPGMVLTLEPGFGFAPGRMMVHEENIVVRENGAELLSARAPRTMPVIA
jgi:Xaa-Pro aminopeptidase